VQVPADLAVGKHTFLATGVDPDGNVLSRALAITVTSTSGGPVTTAPTTYPVPPGPPRGPGEMPRTGQDVALLAGVGLTLVGTGVMLLLVRRRPGQE
jgi:LPXTG-motif cell wall-anchored protein